MFLAQRSMELRESSWSLLMFMCGLHSSRCSPVTHRVRDLGFGAGDKVEEALLGLAARPCWRIRPFIQECCTSCLLPVWPT